MSRCGKRLPFRLDLYGEKVSGLPYDKIGDQLGQAVGELIDAEADERAELNADLLNTQGFEVGEVMGVMPVINRGRGALVFAENEEWWGGEV